MRRITPNNLILKSFWLFVGLNLITTLGVQAQCTFTNLAFDGFEYSTPIPGLIAGTTYHPNPSSYAARTGNKGVYMNFVNNLPGGTLVMSRIYNVCPGYQYKMSAWFKEINGGSSTVTTRIKDGNGTILTTSTATYFAGGGWGQWVSPSVTAITGTLKFELVFVSGVGNNDFGMDDLSIEICTTSTVADSVQICSNALPINLFDSVSTISSTTGTWTGPSALANGHLGTFDPATNAGGIYTYTVTNSVAACPDSVTEFFMDVGQAPIIDLGPDTAICVGDSLSFDVFSANSTYLWQDGSTSSSMVAKNAGTYWVEVTNGCAVVSTDTIVITLTNYPVVDLGTDTILCDGDTLVIDAAYPNATYSWQNASTDSVLTATNSNTYWVDVTDNFCTTRDSIQVTFNLLPVFDLGTDTSICTGDTIELDPGNISSTFLWQDGSTDSVINVSQAGLYYVEVTTLNCSAIDSINISLTAYPTPNLGPDMVVCDGESFYLDAYSVGGTYLWNDGSAGNNLNITQSDTYWVDVSVNGCHSFDTVFYLFNPIPVINLGPDTIVCYPDTLMLNASYPGATYLWQNNTTDSTFEVSAQGNYSVNVNYLNCSYSDTIFVTVQPKPLANLGNDTLICPGTSFTKGNAVSGATYLWQDGNVNFFYDIHSPGEYWVLVTKGDCFNSDTIYIDSVFPPIVNIGEDTLLCEGDSFTMSSINVNSVYEWSTGSTDSIETVGLPGVYWLDVTNICGTVRDEVELTYTTLPEINLGEDTIMCMGDQITIDAYWFNADSYLWFDGWDSPEYLVYEDGDYLVQVTNLCGAIEDTITFEFRHCECDLFIANAFTPNGDAIDEEFGPESFCELKGYNFSIFNRWGQEVFNSIEPGQKWNGMLNGEPLPFGVYSYVLRYNFKKRGPKTNYQVKYGTVTLIR
ncbi:MAG: gliding motility-associated C-terminal domain-containing protein [Salibacteraceae bacterium]